MRKSSVKTIERQIAALKVRADKMRQMEKTPALRAIVGLMREHEISFAELRGALNGRGRRGKPGPKRGRKVKPKYRNPKTGETWSGRGRPARWIAAAEKAGRKRTDFLIRKS
jgi:DNA-binding protein H-NS